MLPRDVMFIKDPFYYQNIPYCVKTSPKNPTQIQCLPNGFQTIVLQETTQTNLLPIRNSLFDNCSPTVGADAGCGKFLQCNFYQIGNFKRYTCEPVLQMPTARERIEGIDLVGLRGESKYELAMWHQTCGPSQFSQFLDMKCDQSTKEGKLICSPVSAYVNGVIGTKSICITPFEAALLQKRVVKAFCYSGCPPGGGVTKIV